MSVTTFLIALIEVWIAWAELFEGFPVGANLGAALSLMLIIMIAAMLARFMWDYMSIE